MQDVPLLPIFLSGLGGAIIGAISTIIVQFVQSRYHYKRELSKLAIDLAIKEHDLRHEYAKEHQCIAYPFSAFIHFNTRLIDLASKGKITPDSLKVIQDENDRIIEALEQMAKERAKTESRPG